MKPTIPPTRALPVTVTFSAWILLIVTFVAPSADFVSRMTPPMIAVVLELLPSLRRIQSDAGFSILRFLNVRFSTVAVPQTAPINPEV